MQRLKGFMYALLAVLLMGSCASVEKIPYFQDLNPMTHNAPSPITEVTLRAGDKISIIVNSKDPQLATLFNLPTYSNNVGAQGINASYSYSQRVSSYTLDSNGEIDFPILGKINVTGMSREQLASHIKSELNRQDLLKDAVVIVEFVNLNFSILGEVTKPGRYEIDRDKFTILDAISKAGDLTIFGQRDKVYVIREEKGKQTYYQVDLTDATGFYKSPVYYHQQNDLIYVRPNETRARQSTVNGNNVLSASFWISIASLLATFINIMTK